MGVGLESYLHRLGSWAWWRYARSKVAGRLWRRLDLFAEEGETVWPGDSE